MLNRYYNTQNLEQKVSATSFTSLLFLSDFQFETVTSIWKLIFIPGSARTCFRQNEDSE